MLVCEVEEAVELEEAEDAEAGCGAARENGEFDLDVRFACGALGRRHIVGVQHLVTGRSRCARQSRGRIRGNGVVGVGIADASRVQLIVKE